jgi:peptide deformylase
MLEILKEDHKLLRRKAKRIDKIDDNIRDLAAGMIESMIAANGIGISGNQVGVLKRIIVVLVNEEPKVMINPEIVFISDELCKIEEGCLSFPGQYYEIERPEKVTVKYRDLSGHPMLETHEGIVARCILHELDHLDGVVFLERK